MSNNDLGTVGKMLRSDSSCTYTGCSSPVHLEVLGISGWFNIGSYGRGGADSSAD